MKRRTCLILTFSVLALLGFLVGGAWGADLPWKEAGLTERQAAAHLLDRFTFGPRPGDIDRVVEMGLDVWLDRQLRGNLPDDELEAKLAPLDTLKMTSQEIAETYPNPGRVLAKARRQGMISMEDNPGDDGTSSQEREMRQQVMEMARRQGYRPQRELFAQLNAQKLYRAVESENQLIEVLTDFWFNHFNVSRSDNRARGYLLAYERDAIRPNVLEKFRTLLGATAAHPAMLFYLDNAQSGAAQGQTTTLAHQVGNRQWGQRGGSRGRGGSPQGSPGQGGRRQQRQRQPSGLNENYARELLELHTLGVDGGYSQQDVIEVARAFTGWAVLPPDAGQNQARLRRIQERGGLGFVIRDDFLFRADIHDAEKKTILGRTFPSGRGIEDGEEVLDLLARHPSTASHLARKIAVRFVSDEPPQKLVDRLAATFRSTDGNLRWVIKALARSPEFWSPEAHRQKIKSPLEVALSALRALDAEIDETRPLVEWISRMGQPLYGYQAPTGFPDRGEAWVNTGSLLNRMNFGLQLATGRIPGVHFDLLALNGRREPESVDEALTTYAARLLPERDLTETMRQLEPVVRDPQLLEKVEAAAPQAQNRSTDQEPPEYQRRRRQRSDDGDMPAGSPRTRARVLNYPPPTLLGSVVGVILGSPEFQRR